MASEEVNLLEEGCRKRLDVWNLYPVLVHVRSLDWGCFYVIGPKSSPVSVFLYLLYIRGAEKIFFFGCCLVKLKKDVHLRPLLKRRSTLFRREKRLLKLVE